MGRLRPISLPFALFFAGFNCLVAAGAANFALHNTHNANGVPLGYKKGRMFDKIARRRARPSSMQSLKRSVVLQDSVIVAAAESCELPCIRSNQEYSHIEEYSSRKIDCIKSMLRLRGGSTTDW
jgi:L-asparagine transporter-like permease